MKKKEKELFSFKKKNQTSRKKITWRANLETFLQAGKK